MIEELIVAAKKARRYSDEYARIHGKRSLVGFMGSPGSGKSTQAKLLAKRIGKYEKVHHINVGEILRSSADEEVIRIMNEGLLVSDELVFKVLTKKFRELDDGFIVLDGFFRTAFESAWLIDQQKELDVDVLGVVDVRLDPDVATKRLKERGRADDEVSDIATRLEIFKKNEKEVLAALKEKKVLVIDIDGDKSIEDIADNVYVWLGDWITIPGYDKEMGYE